MVRRFLPYGIAVAAVAMVAGALGLIAWLLAIPRIETFLLVFVLLVGSIGWRYGRGPAIAGTVAFALVSDYYFLPPKSLFWLDRRSVPCWCRTPAGTRGWSTRRARRQSWRAFSASRW